jgi:ankyrin repeat protein
MRAWFPASLLVLSWSAGALAQTGSKVDFKRDVQPLLKQYCISCHGPSQQMNGFRLDRRSAAMKGGGTRIVIVPGKSDISRFYLRLIATNGTMPPTGRLSDADIALFKNWIDQGAQWPDDVSGDSEPPPVNSGAVRIMNALRQGDEATFKTELKNNPASAHARGTGGSTPLMYAALYGTTESLRELLTLGADPNDANNESATALMWAVDSVDKVRLLLDSGARVDARADDGRTPLLIAAGRRGSTDVVKALLDRGANASYAAGRTTALSLAARAGDDSSMRLLIEHGANLKGDAATALDSAIRAACTACVDLVIAAAGPKAMGESLISQAQFGKIEAVRMFLQRGADVNTKNGTGLTPLLAACDTDAPSVELVRLLLDSGADVAARMSDGKTALNLARRRNNTNLVNLLRKAGARDDSSELTTVVSTQTVRTNNSVVSAVETSLPLLQNSDTTFARRSGCVSCHNNSLTAVTVEAARSAGFAVDERIARDQLEWSGRYAEIWREALLRGAFNGAQDAASYTLVGMAAARYGADAATDALAYFIKGMQMPNGQWRALSLRPPIEYSDITTTATSIRALRTFAPKPHKAEYDSAVQKAATWLMHAEAYATEERAFQLLGLKWADADLRRESVKTMATALLAEQQSDGGWAPLPGMQSDAYATGQALVALHDAGSLSTKAAAYKRGVEYLLQTQLEDGSWHVTTRSTPAQPYFESGFPHGKDQFISIAASNWATLALIFAKPD